MRILYGIDSPENSFTRTGGPKLDEISVTTDSSDDLGLEGVYEISVTDEESVRWVDLMENHGLSKSVHAESLKGSGEDQLSPLWGKLREACNDNSAEEQRFFDLYVEMTIKGAFGGGGSGFGPALIPNVTVNWDTEGEKRDKEPCHVDFLMKHEKVEGGDPTIIELDGIQHFAEKRDGDWEPSPQKYADTLRKSRSLRRSGFKVIRISNSQLKSPLVEEVGDEVEGFYELWKKTFASEAFIDRYEDYEPPPNHR